MSCSHLDLMLQKHLLVNILQFSDDIGQCARSVTTQLREIVGSRIVALFERSPQKIFRLAGICPERRKDFFSDETARRLIDEAARLNEPGLFKPGHGTIGMLLAELQMQASFVIPLRSNEETHGFLLLLDILDLHNTDEILEAFKSMAGLLSLVMRNSFLYRNLEELVRQRTTELHEAGQLNQQILNSIHEGIVVYDKDMRIKAWNPFMENLSGKSADEITGRFPEEVFPFLINTGIKSRLEQVLAGQIPPQIEFEYEINGVHGWAIESQVPLRNESNEVAGIVSTIRDITERKQAEEAMAEEKQRHLDTMNRAARLDSLGILAGGIAHDFNNLLGGIYGYIDIARSQANSQKTCDYLTSALETMSRARALTEQLLTFSKGGAPIKKVENLFPFLEEVTRFALSGANVSCHFDIAENLMACNFDKNQIGQVVENVVINAVQAMPSGGHLEVKARNVTLSENQNRVLKPGNFVELAITDNGVGMPKEVLTHVFDPFYTTKTKGHGLGLATSYSIVLRHGGSIDVTSEPGKGSTFTVLLPASSEVTIPCEIRLSRHSGNGVFLVMDDEEVVREAIGCMLEAFGYTPVMKNNGQEAVNFFVTEHEAGRKIAGMLFDLTIAGGMGGKEAIEEIRKHCRKTPAFVSSGYANDPVMADPKKFGFTACICKPFQLADLANILNQFIEQS